MGRSLVLVVRVSVYESSIFDVTGRKLLFSVLVAHRPGNGDSGSHRK